MPSKGIEGQGGQLLPSPHLTIRLLSGTHSLLDQTEGSDQYRKRFLHSPSICLNEDACLAKDPSLLFSFSGSQTDLFFDVVSKNTDASGNQTPISNSSSTTDMTSDTDVAPNSMQGMVNFEFDEY